MVYWILGVVIVQGYLLGSINTALLVGWFYGVDVRQHGSKNAGMTNTLRTIGKLPAIIVTIGDMFKAVIASFIGMQLLGDAFGFEKVGLILGGFGALLGHIWPVYFSFRGGKGVLTAFALILMMNWQIGLLLFALFAIVVAFSKMVSVGSLAAAISFPVFSWFFRREMGLDAFFLSASAMMCILLVVMHRANIRRLLQGNENRLGQSKKKIQPS